jgi:hypothetical protein
LERVSRAGASEIKRPDVTVVSLFAGAISTAELVTQASSDASREGVHVGIRHPLLGRSLEQVEDPRAAKFRRWTRDNVHVHVLEVFKFREEHDVRLRNAELGLERARRRRDEAAEDGAFLRSQFAE